MREKAAKLFGALSKSVDVIPHGVQNALLFPTM